MIKDTLRDDLRNTDNEEFDPIPEVINDIHSEPEPTHAVIQEAPSGKSEQIKKFAFIGVFTLVGLGGAWALGMFGGGGARDPGMDMASLDQGGPISFQPAAPVSGVPGMDASASLDQPQITVPPQAQKSVEAATPKSPQQIEPATVDIKPMDDQVGVVGGGFMYDSKTQAVGDQGKPQLVDKDLLEENKALKARVDGLETQMATLMTRFEELKAMKASASSVPPVVSKATVSQSGSQALPREAVREKKPVSASEGKSKPASTPTKGWSVTSIVNDRAVLVSPDGDRITVSAGDEVEGFSIKSIDSDLGRVRTTKGDIR